MKKNPDLNLKIQPSVLQIYALPEIIQQTRQPFINITRQYRPQPPTPNPHGGLL